MKKVHQGFVHFPQNEIAVVNAGATVNINRGSVSPRRTSGSGKKMDASCGSAYGSGQRNTVLKQKPIAVATSGWRL